MAHFRHAGMKLRAVKAKSYTAKDRLSANIRRGIKDRDAKVQAEVDISKPYKVGRAP